MSKTAAVETTTDPRTLRSRTAVLEATVELMVERGVHSVSVDAIVERSGVAKTTVYRHWPTREVLIKAAWTSVIPPDTIPATGTVHEQAADIALRFSRRIGTRPMSVLLPDLMAEAGRDESLRQIYEDVLRSRRRTLTEAISSGIRSKSLPSNTDADLASSLILGPIVYEQLVLRQPVDAAFVERIVTTVLDAANSELIRRERPGKRRRPMTQTRKP